VAEGAPGPGTVGRIYGNLGRLLGGKAAAGLVSLAYLAVATRALGPADYGVLVLVHGYAMVVGGIVAFPGWHAIVRYGAQAVEAGDTPRLARLLRFAGLVEGVAGLLAVAVAALLAPILGPRLGWSPAATAFAGVYSFAVLGSIRATPAGYLQLAGRFDLLGAHNLVAPLVRLAGAGLATALHAGLRGFLIAWLVAALAEWAVMWALGVMVARRQLAGTPLLGRVRGVVAENPGLRRFMTAANADITFSELSGRLAPLAIGWVLGSAAAGLYAVAQRATVVLSQPALVLGQAAYAELARLVASGGRGAPLRKALLHCVGVAALSALPVIGLIALFRTPIAVLIGGRAFADAGAVMLWLALARAVLLAAPPTSAALTALGRPGLSVTANLAAGLGLLVILPPMLTWLGLTGAGLHAVLQAAATAGLLGWFIWRETRTAPSRPAAAGG
jgi:O-antigen/teichoic acid export membrane protein